MPNNPTHPTPQVAEPGRLRPDEEIRQPGHGNPARDADTDPLDTPPRPRDPLASPLQEDDDPLAPPL